MQLYNRSIEDDKFHNSGKLSIFSLLDKPGKDPLLLANWRPLSLLNVDNKLYTSHCKQAKLVMPYLINKSHNGFMKNRYIGENLMELHNIIEYCKSKNIEAFIMTVDFEKAFDKMESQPLYSVTSI